MNQGEHHGSKVTLTEILVVLVVLGTMAWVVVPRFSEAAHDAKIGTLHANLQVLRAQIERYRQDHGGRYPSAARFEAQLIEPTVYDGSPLIPGSINRYVGPYLHEIPDNPYTGGNRVSGRIEDNPDWYYDEMTGQILPLGVRQTAY